MRSRSDQRKATSDWMELEKQRGISITSTVLSFEYNGNHINLLDTPGHQVQLSRTAWGRLLINSPVESCTAAGCLIVLFEQVVPTPKCQISFHFSSVGLKGEALRLENFSSARNVTPWLRVERSLLRSC